MTQKNRKVAQRSEEKLRATQIIAILRFVVSQKWYLNVQIRD